MSPLTVRELVGGRYRLEEVLGRGGMGTVWRAYDTRLERVVAVKEVLLPVGDDDLRGAARSRFTREVQAAGRISHPGVVTVYDVLEEDDRLCLVMELVDAPTLAEVITRDGPLPPTMAAALGVRLADAVGAAHAQGVVHRDIKPANVLVPDGPEGAKLADFGIAATLDGTRLTLTGSVLGSPSFMAPEQATGEPSTAATDLYALGATLYYAVEGVPPFEREGALATVAAVAHEPPRQPLRAGPLAPLLHDLMSKEPSVRPGLSEVRARLEAVNEQVDEPTGTVGLATDPDVTVVGVAAPANATQVLPAVPVPSTAAIPEAPPEVVHPAPPVVVAPGRRRPRPRSSQQAARGLGVLIVVVVLLAVAVAWAATRDDGAGLGAATPTTPTTEAAGPSVADATLAGQWVEHIDEQTGFRIAYPADWSVSTDGTLTDFTDPTGATFLRVDWTDEPGPDAVAAWEDLAASFADSHVGYTELRIEPAEFKGFPAAVWEFTFIDDSGERRALDLGMVTGQFGFALFFQSPADQWDELVPVFQRFQDEFTPPPEPEPRPDRPKKDRGDGNDD